LLLWRRREFKISHIDGFRRFNVDNLTIPTFNAPSPSSRTVSHHKAIPSFGRVREFKGPIRIRNRAVWMIEDKYRSLHPGVDAALDQNGLFLRERQVKGACVCKTRRRNATQVIATWGY